MPILARHALIPLVAAAGMGCGLAPPDPALDSPTAKKLKTLATLYSEIAIADRGRGPGDEAAFRAFVRTVPKFTFAVNNLEEPANRDDLFTSDRDGQLLVVRYGVSINGMSKTKAPVVAHEAVGQNGRQLVALANLDVALVGEHQLQELIAAVP